MLHHNLRMAMHVEHLMHNSLYYLILHYLVIVFLHTICFPGNFADLLCQLDCKLSGMHTLELCVVYAFDHYDPV